MARRSLSFFRRSQKMYSKFQKQIFNPTSNMQIEMYKTDFSLDHWKAVMEYGIPTTLMFKTQKLTNIRVYKQIPKATLSYPVASSEFELLVLDLSSARIKI